MTTIRVSPSRVQDIPSNFEYIETAYTEHNVDPMHDEVRVYLREQIELSVETGNAWKCGTSFVYLVKTDDIATIVALRFNGEIQNDIRLLAYVYEFYPEIRLLPLGEWLYDIVFLITLPSLRKFRSIRSSTVRLQPYTYQIQNLKWYMTGRTKRIKPPKNAPRTTSGLN